MRNLFIILLTFMHFIRVSGQDQTPFIPHYNNTVKYNYSRIWVPQGPLTDLATLTSMPTQSVREVTQYSDGLGRPIQTVNKEGSLETNSNTAKDIISAFTYDAFGRQVRNYLPFASAANDGSFQLNAFDQQATFNQGEYGSQGETWFYSRTNFESSPLNRVTEVFAPGNSWVGTNAIPDPSQRKSLKTKYYTNVRDDDDVKIFTVQNGANIGDFGTYSVAGIYESGQLLKTISEDEQGHQQIQFVDKSGKTVLQKVQLTNGTTYGDWLSTYYVYDDLGQLRSVIQPQGVKILSEHNWDFSYDTYKVVSDQCFRYEYDDKGRLIVQKVPGAKEVYMVYDANDRLVFTQDGNMRLKSWWLGTGYDGSNRPIVTGMMTYPGTRAQLQAYEDDPVNANGASNVSIQGSKLPADLVVWSYDPSKGVYQASQSITFENGFDSQNSEFTAEITDGSTSISNILISGNPFSIGQSFTVLSLNYYDTYTTQKTYDVANNSKLDAGNNSYPEDLPSVSSVQTKQLVTSTKRWVIEDPDNLSKGRWLETVNFYDTKGRLIQTQTDNINGGIDKITTRYDYTSKPICTYLSHINPFYSPTAATIKTNYEYDVLGRLRSIKKRMNDQTSSDETIMQLEYDALGRLNKKTLGQNLGEELSYNYNIRGWILGMNRDFITNSTAAKSFAYELNYDKLSPSYSAPNFAAQYNGNVAGLLWRSKGDLQLRRYDYAYDNGNRLTAADFNQYTSGAFNKNAGIDYSVSNLSYDNNGNIKKIDQKGLQITGSNLIDQLNYTYQKNTNKLQNVIDLENQTSTTLGDFNTSSLHPQKSVKDNYISNPTLVDPETITDYTYDDNGNLLKDLNKNIGTQNTNGITYNYLNRPQVITFYNGLTQKGKITFIYDASGNKLKKTVEEDNVSFSYNNGSISTDIITTTTYFGPFVYESKHYSNSTLSHDLDYSDKLQFISHEQGRIRPINNNQFAYDFFVKDYLGNVRTVLTEETQPPSVYLATMELANQANETQLFKPITNDDKPYGFDNNSNNYKVSKLFNSATDDKRVGPGVVLKVMAGDKFKASVYGWYNPGSDASLLNGAQSITSSLVSAFTGNVPLGTNHSGQELNSSGGLNVPINDFLATQPNTGTGVPKAYLNWILFDDEQFKLVNGNYGANPVPAITGTMSKQLIQSNNGNDIEIKRNGYLYVYVSNESKGNVYFDDLSIIHTRGNLLEETHYYPFGLTMSGISSKALMFGDPSNRIKYNSKELQNKEFTDGSGLEWYDYGMRESDPQLGRFFRVDPLTNKFPNLTPYQYASNDPIQNIDLDGLEGVGFTSEWGVSQIWKSAGFSSDGRMDPNSDLGKAYSWKNMPSLFTKSALALGAYYLTLEGFGFGANGVLNSMAEAEAIGWAPHPGAMTAAESEQAATAAGMAAQQRLLARNQIAIETMGYYSQVSSEILATDMRLQGVGINLSEMVSSPEFRMMGSKVQAEEIGAILQQYGSEGVGQVGRYLNPTGVTRATFDLTKFEGFGEIEDLNEIIKTSSTLTNPSRTYTIFNAQGDLYKFGVTDAGLNRYWESITEAGPNSYGYYSKNSMPKYQAHQLEKYLRSLQYNSTGQYGLPGMKVPYPVDFTTGLPIRPF